MMNVIFAAALFTFSKATECQNYIQIDENIAGPHLYPIGQCYHENNAEDIDSNHTDWESTIFLCENDGNGGLEAVEYEVGPNCNMTSTKIPTGNSYPCNGPNAGDTCSCQLNGDASECSFYEREGVWTYDSTLDCRDIDVSQIMTVRYIVDMCIQNDRSGVETGHLVTGDIYSDVYGCDSQRRYIWIGSTDNVCNENALKLDDRAFYCFDGTIHCDVMFTTTESPISTPAPTADANYIYHIGGFIYVFLFAIYFSV